MAMDGPPGERDQPGDRPPREKSRGWRLVTDSRSRAGHVALNLLVGVVFVLLISEFMLRLPPLLGSDPAVPERDPTRNYVLAVGDSMTRAHSLPEDETCCGFGGLFSLWNEEISVEMGLRKARNLKECGAELVVVNDAGCMTHLNGILIKEGHSCRAIHIAELLAENGTD